MTSNLRETIEHVMSFIEDDYTELWVIVNKVYEENPELNFDELIEATKQVIRVLVDTYGVLLMDDKTQKPMRLNSSAVLKIVEEHLKTLNKIPNIGDGLWFTIEP